MSASHSDLGADLHYTVIGAWWRHQIVHESFSALLALCAGNVVCEMASILSRPQCVKRDQAVSLRCLQMSPSPNGARPSAYALLTTQLWTSPTLLWLVIVFRVFSLVRCYYPQWNSEKKTESFHNDNFVITGGIWGLALWKPTVSPTTTKLASSWLLVFSAQIRRHFTKRRNSSRYRTANIPWRTCVVVKQMQSNPVFKRWYASVFLYRLQDTSHSMSTNMHSSLSRLTREQMYHILHF